jgi:hypothetical protein
MLPYSRKRQGGSNQDPRGQVQFQVREIEADYAGEGHPEDSVVIIRYMSGPDWRQFGNKRLVHWEHEVGLATETVHAGIQNGTARLIRGGAQKRVPITTIRAILDGAKFNMASQVHVGKVNNGWFRFWPTKKVMFMGASSRPITGSDPIWYKSNTVLEFQARPDGWAHKQVRKPDGINPEYTTTGDGQIVVQHDEWEIAQTLDFRGLFPEETYPGFLTFSPAPGIPWS